MFFPFHDDNPIRRTPVVTYVLIAVNVVSFVGVWRMTPPQQQKVAYQRGFVPRRIAQLADHKPIQIPLGEKIEQHPDLGPVRVPQVLTLTASPPQIVMSLLTCMFLHGGWMHLIGNMWFLYVFGNNVEDHLGAVPFLAIYLLGGLLASAAHWAAQPMSEVPVIGASGAVATILGAYAITWPWARVHTLVFLFIFITIIDLPALMVLGAWFLVQFLSAAQSLDGRLVTSVAWWAHVGGFIAGVILMPLFGSAVGAPEVRRVVRKRSRDDDEDDDWW